MIRLVVLFLLMSSMTLFSQSTKLVEKAKDHLRSKKELYGLTDQDIDHSIVSDYYYSKGNDAHYFYFQQSINEVGIYNTMTSVILKDDGRAFNSGHAYIRDAANKVTTSNDNVSPENALDFVVAELGLPRLKSDFQFIGEKNFKTVELPSIAYDKIKAEKLYFPVGDQLVLSWRIEIDSKFDVDYWSIMVNADNGKIIGRFNHTLKCGRSHNHPSSKSSAGVKSDHNNEGRADPNRIVKPSQDNQQITDGAQYRAYPYYVESPNHGDQELIVDPADPIASPFGWHDIFGTPGATYTITRGNNVHAYQDLDGINSSSNDEPDGGNNLIFDFPHDPTIGVKENLAADVTQLYYMNNAVHDWSYKMGFDERSGNYQRNNYDKGGRDRDHVVAHSLDGLNTGNNNNANFSLSSDGSAGRMQMFKWEAGANDLFILSPENIVGNFKTNSSSFGPGRVDSVLEGRIILIDDGDGDTTDACEEIINGDELNGNIALIRRGTCFFSEKVYNAQQKGAIAVIICNNVPDQIITMGGATNAELVTIPAYFMYKDDCDPIEQAILEGEEVRARFEVIETEDLSSGFDNGIISHEYGHGISSRFTGGPRSASCLNNDEEMGEGWSDFIALAITSREGDSGSMGRGIGTYVLGDKTVGGGIRRFKYSTDMGIDPSTMNYARGTGSSPHALGSVWTAMIWDLYWAYVDLYGFDPEWKDENSGNFRAVKLIFDGMRAQPCRPGFIEARDAILLADEIETGGTHKCMIWEVFARRGAGTNAIGGSTDSRTDNVEDFETLPSCIKSVKIQKDVRRLASVGDTVEVTVTAVNHTEALISNARITTEIPSNAVYITGSASEGGSFNGSDGTVSFSVGDMPLFREAKVSYKIKLKEENPSESIITENFSGETFLFNQGIGSGNASWIVDDTPGFFGFPTVVVRNDSIAETGAIVSDPITLSQDRPVFSFWHQYNTEFAFDGGIVEISEDGGISWNYIPKELFLYNPYPSELVYFVGALESIVFGIDKRELDPFAFTGSSDGLIQSFIDLSDYKDKEVSIRFNWGSDGGTGVDGPTSGWQIDQVELMDLEEVGGMSCISGDGMTTVCTSASTLLRTSETISSTNDIVKSEYNISVYPNPSSEYFNVNLSLEDSSDIGITLSDASGRQLINTQESNAIGSVHTQIGVVDIPTGIYFLQLNISGKIFNQKVIIQKE